MRTCGNFAAAFSFSKWLQRCTCIAMFDCPDASHTSPTSTSLTVSVFLPDTVSVSASPAGRGSSFTDQLPARSAVVFFVCLPSVTLTSSPASAQPQTGTAASRWSTAWSLKTLGSFTSAGAPDANRSTYNYVDARAGRRRSAVTGLSPRDRGRASCRTPGEGPTVPRGYRTGRRGPSTCPATVAIRDPQSVSKYKSDRVTRIHAGAGVREVRGIRMFLLNGRAAPLREHFPLV
jgi:hypothetical protein